MGKPCGSTAKCRHRPKAPVAEIFDPNQTTLTLVPKTQEPTSETASNQESAHTPVDGEQPTTGSASDPAKLKIVLMVQSERKEPASDITQVASGAEAPEKEIDHDTFSARIDAEIELNKIAAEQRKMARDLQRKQEDDAEAEAADVKRVSEDVVEEKVREDVPAAAEGAADDDGTYCGAEKKNGRPCRFDISKHPCPVHKGLAVTESIQKSEEFCNKLRRDNRPCQWLVSKSPCPMHSSTADDDAKEAARLLLPMCQETTRGGKPCGERGCRFHAKPEDRCKSMKDEFPELQCFGTKIEGSEFCILHQEFPNLGVNMVEMLKTVAGDQLTEDDFRARYYPGNATAFCFDWAAYVRSFEL
jgi:hypothetical protein